MLEFLPDDVRRGLMAGPEPGPAGRRRLSVHVGDAVFPILRLWDGGFAVSTARTPGLRGLVDLFDGARHLSRCLIVASATDDDTTVYEIKRATVARDRAARDYAEGDDGVLPRPD